MYLFKKYMLVFNGLQKLLVHKLLAKEDSFVWCVMLFATVPQVYEKSGLGQIG